MDKTPHCIICHGTGGSPEGNWFPWLAEELKKLDCEVSVPSFPPPEEQSLESWIKAFEEQVGELKPEQILIGHSMGVGLILRLLEESDVKIKGAFLVSGWEGLLNSKDFDPLIESFYLKPFDYQAIREKIGFCKLYHGSDDPYVPLTMGKELANNLKAELSVIEKGGHLNAEVDFLKFPELATDIKKFISFIKG